MDSLIANVQVLIFTLCVGGWLSFASLVICLAAIRYFGMIAPREDD